MKSLSSNRSSPEEKIDAFGGQGWVIAPDGEVLGHASRKRPFVIVEIDLRQAEQARRTYPRYAIDWRG